MTQKDNFERLWKDFISRLKGQILSQSKQKTLTYSYIKLLLENEVYSWDSDYEECGRWLKTYINENPRSGEMIRDILLNDMTFTEITPAKKSDILNYVVPAIGAIAGLGISSILNAGIIVKIVSTVVPGAVLYPATKSVSSYINDYNNQKLIDDYIGQLDKYRLSIISVIDENII